VRAFGPAVRHSRNGNAVRDSAEVVAVAEPNPDQAERIRSLFGSDVRIYPGYEELLNDAPVDAVDILLPHDLHVPATAAATTVRTAIRIFSPPPWRSSKRHRGSRRPRWLTFSAL